MCWDLRNGACHLVAAEPGGPQRRCAACARMRRHAGRWTEHSLHAAAFFLKQGCTE